MSRLLRDLDARLRRLDDRLGIDHEGRSEAVWLAPLGTLLGTIALVCAVGVTSGVGAALYAPLGVFVGLVMAGMSVAYMTPRGDAEPGDGGGGSEAPHPVAPEPPPWYRRLAEAVREEPAPRAPRCQRERERSGTR
jgi:hypothetical protein